MIGPTRGRRRWPSLAVASLLAFVVALGLVASPPAAAPVRAATPDLTIVTSALYDVRPDERLVRVTVDLTATNRLKDTATRRFYFDRASLAVMPGTSNFAISGGSGRPSVAVSRSTADFTLLQIAFGQRINAGQSAKFRLTFDLADPGGDAARTVRVGTALVAFPAWAFATDETPGSSVTVSFPADFEVETQAGDLPDPTEADGRLVYSSGALDAPLDFFAYFVADRPAELTETARRVSIGSARADLAIRAWPDDPEWAERVGDLFVRGLPVLSEAVGLPWTRTEPLVVQETVSRATGGYAGVFDPSAGRFEVAYYADEFVVLHEAAHAWFNGSLLADRWSNEAFASWYAVQAATALGLETTPPAPPAEPAEAAIPLNAWGQIGAAPPEVEDYAYAAVYQLAAAIAERAGADVLRDVWAAAARGEGAYQPVGAAPTESADGPPDWRGLLDLLEEHAGKSFDDLWADWVVRDDEAHLLEERRQAREEYAAVLEAAGDWRLPREVRTALRAWQFDDAQRLLDEATGLLDRRGELESAASAAGLTLPTTLKARFESSFADATAEADAEAAAIEAVAIAEGSRLGQPDPIESLGLLGSDPDATLAAARESFAAGDLVAAVRGATDAQATWVGAWEIGRNRILAGAGVALLIVLGIAFAANWLLRRRTEKRRASVGEAGSANP